MIQNENQQEKKMTNLEDVHFYDLFDQKEIQELQDLFSEANGVSSVIMDLEGNLLTTRSNYTNLCNLIIAKAPLGSTVFFAMDQWHESGSKNIDQTLVSPCKKTGLWFQTAYITVEDKPIAIWQIGQVRSISYDMSQLEEYAKNSNIEPDVFLKAYLKAPVVSISQFERIAKLFFFFANELSEKAYKNLLLKKQIQEIEDINVLLADREETLSITLHSIADGVISTDMNGAIVNMNKIAAKMCGVYLKDVKGNSLSSVFRVFNADTKEPIVDPVKRVLQTNQITTLAHHTLMVSKDGAEYQISNSAAPIKNKLGEISGVVLVFSDVTEKYKSEIALRESETRFKALHDASFGGIVIHDTGLILECNQGLSDITNFSHEELIGMNGLELVAPDYRDYVLNNIATGFEKSYGVMGIRKNGEEYPLRIQGKNIPYKGNPVRATEFRDISEQKLEEAALIKDREEALESYRLQSEFIVNLSHDIRTPMNGILGFADLLKEPDVTREEHLEYLEIIEKSGDRMLNIINEIINISKIEAGSMKTNISTFNLKSQLDSIYNTFKSEAESKKLKFNMVISKEVESISINSDQEKASAILINIVDNAIKFTEAGSVEFGVSKKDNLLEFYVKDTGSGITPERQKKIFNRYNKDLQEVIDSPKGPGLGLSITKAYVEMLGGSISFISQVGEGTTFYFTLSADLSKLREDKTAKTKTNVFNLADLSNLKILIAEDDETSELLLRTYLEPYASSILSAKNGLEAVEMFKNNQDIDLIMMDIQMPLMNGLTATEQIRTFNSKVVIIAQTAFGLSGDRDKAIAAGCSDYISKPIKKEELKTMVRNYFL